MKFSINVAIALCLLFSFSLCGAQTATAPVKPFSPAEQALVAAEKSFIAAAKKGDVSFFKRTLTNDFSFVSYDGQLYQRQDMLEQYSQPGTDVMPYEIQVIVPADGVGIVTYNVVLRVPPAEDQGPPPRYQHFSTVWVRQGDAWKMKFQQMTAAHWGDW